MEDTTVHIANGQDVECKITQPVEVQWKDRHASGNAIVIPSAKKVLLGALAIEAMDLIVCPKKQKVVGAHGDSMEFLAL